MRKKLTAKTVENLPEAQGRDMRSGTLLSGALASSDVQRCDEVQGFLYAKPDFGVREVSEVESGAFPSFRLSAIRTRRARRAPPPGPPPGGQSNFQHPLRMTGSTPWRMKFRRPRKKPKLLRRKPKERARNE